MENSEEGKKVTKICSCRSGQERVSLWSEHCKILKLSLILVKSRELNNDCLISSLNSQFLPLENMDEDFYNKYQPVLFDLLGNSDDFVIGMYYNISRCLP